MQSKRLSRVPIILHTNFVRMKNIIWSSNNDNDDNNNGVVSTAIYINLFFPHDDFAKGALKLK